MGILLNYAAAAVSHFSRVRLCDRVEGRPPGSPVLWILQKNTGVGCHFLLQCVKVRSESEVAQLCLTLSDLMDRSLPGSSIHGIFQARVLEWGAIAFSEAMLGIPICLCFWVIPLPRTPRPSHDTASKGYHSLPPKLHTVLDLISGCSFFTEGEVFWRLLWSEILWERKVFGIGVVDSEITTEIQ